MIAVPIHQIGKIEVQVCVTGMRAWSFRVWLMTCCLRVAGWVAPKNVSVTVQHD